MAKTKSATHKAYAHRALVLQGGGALGAYQAGVYEGLAQADIPLTHLAGISIGALNIAIIAGNPPEKRVERLHEFWDTICQPYTNLPAFPYIEKSLFSLNDMARESLAAMHAGNALMFGQKGFFRPRIPPPILSTALEPTQVSYYDTRPLKQTLESLCDFDRINQAGLRVSVGAVNVRSGNFIYFDNQRIRLLPEHFMASGALPPAFAPVEIDGELYWDGGLVSNTPLAEVLTQQPERDTLVFQVDLWSAQGAAPRNLSEIGDRIQDIRYSSRTRLVTELMRSHRKMQRLLQQVMQKVPAELRATDPVCQQAARQSDAARSNVIHLIYRDKPYDQHFRDFQFGPAVMREHWASGLQDIRATLAHPEYLTMPDDETGFVTHDIHRNELEKPMKQRTKR